MDMMSVGLERAGPPVPPVSGSWRRVQEGTVVLRAKVMPESLADSGGNNLRGLPKEIADQKGDACRALQACALIETCPEGINRAGLPYPAHKEELAASVLSLAAPSSWMALKLKESAPGHRSLLGVVVRSAYQDILVSVAAMVSEVETSATTCRGPRKASDESPRTQCIRVPKLSIAQLIASLPCTLNS